jgi:AcrR family transcriptional regulator
MPQPPPIDGARIGLDQLVHPPLRADARRNYNALLAAADELFTSHGPDVSLDEIARRAGVGNATLYRHFPDRRDLLVAVCVGEYSATNSKPTLIQAGHSPAGCALTSSMSALSTAWPRRSPPVVAKTQN